MFSRRNIILVGLLNPAFFPVVIGSSFPEKYVEMPVDVRLFIFLYMTIDLVSLLITMFIEFTI